MRSAKLSQRSFAISEARTKPPRCARATRLRQRIRRVDDIGISEQQIGRRRRRSFGMRDALMLRPELAGPAGRQRAARQARSGGRRHRAPPPPRGDPRRGVGALVVDQDHIEIAGIVLPQQRSDGLPDRFRLVARRNDGGNGRPRRRPRPSAVVALGREPESSSPRPGDRARSQAPLTLGGRWPQIIPSAG